MKAPKHKLKRKDRPEEKYEVSRWTPVVQDIAEVRCNGVRAEEVRQRHVQESTSHMTSMYIK